MSTVPLGKLAKLSVGGKEITGVATGVDGLTRGVSRSTTVVPGGRGVKAVQPSNFMTHDFGCVADANSTNDPVFRAANGTRAAVIYTDATGRVYTTSCVMTVGLSLELESDRQIYTVAFAVDGKPTIS